MFLHPQLDQICGSALCNGIVGAIHMRIASSQIDIIDFKDISNIKTIKSDNNFEISSEMYV